MGKANGHVMNVPERFRRELKIGEFADAEYAESTQRVRRGSGHNHDTYENEYAEYAEYADLQEESEIKPFPVEVLPESCQRLIRESAASIDCPPDFIGLPLLAALGSAIGNSRKVEVKQGWKESAAIYGAVVADPGTKKTPAQNVALEAIKKQESQLKRDHKERVRDYEKRVREHEKDKRDAKKADGVEPEEPEEPNMERAIVEDATVEALTDVLEGSPRGVMVVKDELASWTRSMDQYKSGKGSDRQFWLSAWSNSYVSVDRRGRQEPLTLESPFVSVVGSIQPSVLPEIAEGREDGMMDRFLFAYPESRSSRWSDHEITDEAREGVRDLHQGLRKRHMQEDEYGEPVPALVALSPEARELFREASNDLRQEMDSLGFPARLKGPWSKLEGYLARFSLILAMARSVEHGGPERVEKQDVLRAVSLIGYFKNHARRVCIGLHNEDPLDGLALELAGLLASCNGYWKGQPSELYELLPDEHKPERPKELSTALSRIAKRSPDLTFGCKQENYFREDGKRTKRNVWTLTLNTEEVGEH